MFRLGVTRVLLGGWLVGRLVSAPCSGYVHQAFPLMLVRRGGSVLVLLPGWLAACLPACLAAASLGGPTNSEFPLTWALAAPLAAFEL